MTTINGSHLGLLACIFLGIGIVADRVRAVRTARRELSRIHGSTPR